MFCLVCGAKIDDEAVCCPVCGSAVKISPPRPDEVKSSIRQEDKKSEICPACGFMHPAGMMFCPRCGMSQSLYFKDGMNNEQTNINGFEKFPEARGRDPRRGFNKFANREPERDFEKHAAPQSRGPERDFEKYAAPQSRGPERDFEKYAAPQSRGPERDFEKYPEHAAAPRRSLVGLLVAAVVVIAAVAIAVYFFM